MQGRSLHETTPSLCGMEQHGVRAYLSLVGTGVLVLLHVWPMDAVDDGVYWVGSDSSTVGLSGPAGPEFFRRSGLLLPSLFLSLAEETVDPSWTPFLLAVKISDRRCFWESPTSPPSSDMDAASFIISSTLGWSSRASWSSRTSKWFGLPRSRDSPCVAWTFHDAGFVC